MISYLFIVAMVIISILYKMNMEKKNKMREFSILNKVGYVYSDLKQILFERKYPLFYLCFSNSSTLFNLYGERVYFNEFNNVIFL